MQILRELEGQDPQDAPGGQVILTHFLSTLQAKSLQHDDPVPVQASPSFAQAAASLAFRQHHAPRAFDHFLLSMPFIQ
jgi:hypothetical protein